MKERLADRESKLKYRHADRDTVYSERKTGRLRDILKDRKILKHAERHSERKSDR